MRTTVAAAAVAACPARRSPTGGDASWSPRRGRGGGAGGRGRDALISHGVNAWVVPSADTTHAFAVFVKALAAPRPTGSLADGERWDPTQGEELWAYVARLSRHEQFIVWPSGPDGEPVPPTFVYRLRVDDDGDHYDLVPPHTAVASIDPAPLREAADQVADTANELQAAVDEALSAVGDVLDDADDSH